MKKEVNSDLSAQLGRGTKNTLCSRKNLDIWKDISSKNDIEIFFADSGSPEQRNLKEDSNGLLRRDGLPKQTDFRETEEEEIISVAEYRNNIPHKSLGYRTPEEVFDEYLSKSV